MSSGWRGRIQLPSKVNHGSGISQALECFVNEQRKTLTFLKALGRYHTGVQVIRPKSGKL